jgi:feruloyl-CoA synthase
MLRPVDILEWKVRVERAGHATYVKAEGHLSGWPARLTDKIDQWAAETPDRPFLAQRDASHRWRSLTYREFRDGVRRVAQGLLDAGLDGSRSIAILSGNSIDHALLAYGAMYAGIPHAPVSPAYSTVSKDYSILRTICGVLRPHLIFASGAIFDRAIDAVQAPGVVVVKDIASLMPQQVTPDVDRANGSVTADTVAKVLFTSGSTGTPKGVLNTHRMLCSNQEMIRAVMRPLAEAPPVICDWLPWHHTFGGNHNIGLILYNGGTLYIDEGKPVPERFPETVRNLREISPTVYFNVPKGYELLVRELRKDPVLRETFYKRLGFTFFAAAGLSGQVWDDLDAISLAHCGERIAMLSGLGATETAPFALCTGKALSRSGAVGLPVPGVELKLARVGDKWEARVKGPNVTPGFLGDPELTRDAFDEEGYYKMGDALRWLDPDDPQKGLVFDGRLKEDFKLSSGTWVSLGPLRLRLIAHFSPYVSDVVLVGADRDDVGALIFPALPEADPDTFRALLRSFAEQATGSASCVRRIIIMREPPSLDAHEITDKGSLNQQAVRERRAALIDDLYAVPVPPHVIAIDPENNR